MAFERIASMSALALVCLSAGPPASAQEQLIRAELLYRAPGSKPAPNFSAGGMRVPLTALPAGAALPAGSVAPARSGIVKVGLDEQSWIPLLLTADATAPQNRRRLFLDLNRSGSFADDGEGWVAILTQDREQWRLTFDAITLKLDGTLPEPFAIGFFTVGPERSVVPSVINFVITSWRSGSVMINGVPAVVAAMDFSRDGVFGPGDQWAVIGAAEPNAPAAVLSVDEMRATTGLMFVRSGAKEIVLEFRSFSPDGRSVTFAVVNRPVTKAEYRATADLSPAVRAATVWTEYAPDLMRACGPQLRAALLRRAQIEVAKGAARAVADDTAKTDIVTLTQGVVADELDRITTRRVALVERAKNGNPYVDQNLLMCMVDRRLAQIAGGVVTGLKAKSSKGPGIQP